MNSSSLPEFEKPPVSEVALSMQFDPLPGWRAPYAGLYWSRINTEYSTTEVHPPLPSQIETFEEGWQPPSVRIEMIAGSDVNRTWFIASPPTHLLQIQRDRFIVNWRKVKGNEVYPRYEKDLKPRLLKEWQKFQDFVQQEKLGTINVVQCEIAYFNDILRGEGWDNFAESLTLLSSWCSKGTTGFLPAVETLTIGGAFRMRETHGRLHFGVQHVLRGFDQKEALQLRLMARGRPKSSKNEDILGWMDLGHEWIVRGFTDLTSPKAHDLWKRIR